MAKQRAKFSRSRLREAYLQDLAAAWAEGRRLHPGETPYAFVLYGTEGRIRLGPCLLTEEGLTKVAQRYVKKEIYETVDKAREALRFSVTDSPYFNELQELIPTVDALVEPSIQELDEEAGYKRLGQAAIEALVQLDEQGLFGKGRSRERIVLLAILEGTEDDWLASSAKKLNPKAVYEHFKKHTQVKGTYGDCEAFIFSHHEDAVYFVGSREHPERGRHGNPDFLAELVACDFAKGRFRRRWDLSFPLGRNGFNAIAWEKDQHSFLALQRRDLAWVLRFAINSPEPLQKVSLLGDARSIAVSQDGSYIAVTSYDGMLHVLDAGLNVIRKESFDTGLGDVIFLRSGLLLVAGDSGILSVNPATGQNKQEAEGVYDYLSTDAQGSLLLASRHFPMFNHPDYETEFGASLLKLPSCKPVRTFLIPGHKISKAAISPDGSLIACEAKQINKPLRVKNFIAVFTTASGREVARRPCDGLNRLAFMRDSRTIAMAVDGFTETEPIEFWTLPESC